jgi:hypothetical protein
MADPPPLKRPKLEKDGGEDRPRASANGAAPPDDEGEDAMAEEALVALVAHRERDVERCKLKLLHYQSLVPLPLPSSSLPSTSTLSRWW